MPRTEVIERVVYSFDELTDDAKKTARQEWVDQNRDYPYEDWWQFDDFVTCASLLGIEIDCEDRTNPYSVHNIKWAKPKIYFSGFSSQGDGASFVGHYRSKPDALAAIIAHAPTDETLRDFAERLTALQVTAMLEFSDQIEAEITKSSSNYSHSMTMHVNVLAVERPDSEIADHEIKELTDILRSFADWMYGELEAQYHWHFSDECLDGELQDGEFAIDGSLL